MRKKTGCEMRIHVNLSKDGRSLQVMRMHEQHNHPVADADSSASSATLLSDARDPVHPLPTALDYGGNLTLAPLGGNLDLISPWMNFSAL